MGAILSVAIAIGLVGAEHAQRPPPKTELHGTWFGEWSQVSGGPPIRSEPGSVLLTFHYYIALIARGLLPESFNAPNANAVALGFSLNTQAVPKQIDYWEMWEDGTPPVRKLQPTRFLAVYELNGDELRLAVPTCDDGGPFPTMVRNGGRRPALVSGDQPCSMLLVLKRH